jgi:Mrp family chromosome partitioning ATPase
LGEVVVDSPPLLGTEDARTLALAAKGILLVVSGGAATSSVNEAVLSLEALRAPLLGVIANRFHEVGGSYNYYY